MNTRTATIESKHVVWKYPVDPFGMDSDGTCRIEMPIGARVLCFQLQNNTPTIWAEVDPSAEKMPKQFRVYGTGHTIAKMSLRYIGTVVLFNDSLVLHLYEELPPSREVLTLIEEMERL